MRHGVVLYGPPASGKSTITRELERLGKGYQLFHRLKAGAGSTDGYRMITPEALEKLNQAGEIVWLNHRYGASYGIDRQALDASLDRGVPVAHLGQPEAIAALRASVDASWLVVELRCGRPEAERRLGLRGSVDVDARLAAWDETRTLSAPDLVINTEMSDPKEAASEIHAAIRGLLRTSGDVD